jgi:cyclophilin family peptidyl-prolyl cis-trans isomerase
MKKGITTLFTFLMATTLIWAQSKDVKVKFITSKGDITVVLYKETPLHQAMFLKAIEEGVYDEAVFNRVIKGFVSQGGELDDVILAEEAKRPEKTPRRLPGEFPSRGLHKLGALGAGRDDNPEKASYYNQIYFVTGRIHTAEQLDALEKRKGTSISKEARAIYQDIGGEPRLDGDYTIFGEILEGLEVLHQINTVATGEGDVPLERVTFKVVKE